MQLTLDGCDGGHTGGVKQGESEETDCGQRREEGREGSRGVDDRRADEDAQRTDHRLLGRKTGDEGGRDAPVGKAKGGEDRRDQAADGAEQAVRAVLNDVEAQVESLKEPDEDGCHEDNGEGLLQEVLRLIPHQHKDALGGREAVVGQLHDEGDGLAAVDSAAHDQRADDAHHHAANVQRDHHQRPVVREESHGEDRVDRDLGRAAHEGGEQDGHLAVALGREGAGGHDGRHRAAEADQHRNEATPGEADFAQQLIHDEGDAGHVAGVLENGQEEEEHHNDRQEAEHTAHAGENAVDDEAMYNRVDPGAPQRAVDRRRQRVDAQRH